MWRARVQFFSVSLDGFGTGVGLTRDAPFGHAGERLHQWMFETAWWKELVGEQGGTRGIDDTFVRLHDQGVGAEIMGAGKYGYPGWHEDPEWKGWWGPEPPFHTPVFVLTHHTRPSIEMEGGTTFHFRDTSPAGALAEARAAANGLDVRIGGGPTTIREFAAAGLIDHLHITVVPILLGRGVRLWDGLEGIERDYDVETIASPSGVVHLSFTRRQQAAQERRPMTEDRRAGAIQVLLEQAAEAHHAYERDELEGVFDEQWPAWYGAWIVEHGLGKMVERDVSASEAGVALTRAWAALEEIDPKPAEPWAAWTARHIAADL